MCGYERASTITNGLQNDYVLVKWKERNLKKLNLSPSLEQSGSILYLSRECGCSDYAATFIIVYKVFAIVCINNNGISVVSNDYYD